MASDSQQGRGSLGELVAEMILIENDSRFLVDHAMVF